MLNEIEIYDEIADHIWDLYKLLNKIQEIRSLDDREEALLKALNNMLDGDRR